MQPLSRSEENRIQARALDFPRLTQLARRLISPCVRLAMLSDEKKYIWSEHESISLALGTLGEDPNFSMMNIEEPHRFLFTDRTLLELPLRSDETEPFALLYLFDHQTNLDEACLRTDGIDLFVQQVVTEFSHLQTVSRLSSELSNRSDELDLVMHIQDASQKTDDWKQTIFEHLREFDDALEFGMSAVLFTRYSLTPHVRTWQRHSSEETAILKMLKNEVLPWVVLNDHAAIVNHPSDPLQSDISPGLPFKLMITPLNDSYGRVVGAMITLNAYHDRDFTQGNHNLQDLLAKRIANEYDMHHDPLTGLLNREGFHRCLDESYRDATVNSSEHTLMRIDVDRMRPLNELAGFAKGDEALQLVGQAIFRHIRSEDFTARTHGDVFYCLLNHCPTGEGEVIANRILREMRESEFLVEGQIYPLTVSIGLTAINTACDSIKSAITAAEVACEAAKEAGHDRLRVFTRSNINLLQREKDFESINQIQRALQNDRFVLFAQKIFPLQSDEPYQHYEILMRMIDQNGEVVPPMNFLPVAERYQMMPMIDSWVTRHALKLLARIRLQDGQPLPVWNINISGLTIGDEMFQMELENALQTFNINPASICLEIKETSAGRHIQHSRDFLESLRERGLLVALDDFGTGVTSFAYLQNIDIDHLKIDGSFVRQLTTDKVAATIVASIQQVARSMNIRTVAEKVEDDATVARARNLGIDMAQGFCLHKPQRLEEIIDLLNSGEAVLASPDLSATKDNGLETVTETPLKP